MIQNLDTMPTLSVGENENQITKDRVLEILKPFREGLSLLSSDEEKKAWLKNKRDELNDEDGSLNEAHEKLTRYAVEQVKSLGFEEDTPENLSTYFYIHGLIRYKIV